MEKKGRKTIVKVMKSRTDDAAYLPKESSTSDGDSDAAAAEVSSKSRHTSGSNQNTTLADKSALEKKESECTAASQAVPVDDTPKLSTEEAEGAALSVSKEAGQPQATEDTKEAEKADIALVSSSAQEVAEERPEVHPAASEVAGASKTSHAAELPAEQQASSAHVQQSSVSAPKATYSHRTKEKGRSTSAESLSLQNSAVQPSGVKARDLPVDASVDVKAASSGQSEQKQKVGHQPHSSSQVSVEEPNSKALNETEAPKPKRLESPSMLSPTLVGSSPASPIPAKAAGPAQPLQNGLSKARIQKAIPERSQHSNGFRAARSVNWSAKKEGVSADSAALLTALPLGVAKWASTPTLSDERGMQTGNGQLQGRVALAFPHITACCQAAL